MRRLRPSLRLLLFSLPLLTFPTFLFPPAARASCYKPGPYNPPVQGTTHIESISPQVALPGVTRVYIQGYCFGDTQGTGSITLNGEVMTNIVFWTDAEIEFIPPFDATSGNLVVTSSSYGSDSSANEAGCKSFPTDYCGNDSINASFTVVSPGPPPFFIPANSPGCNSPQPCPLVSGTPSVPQYVAGTWYYNDGGETMTLTLTQGTQNSNGTWPITGTEETNTSPGKQYQVSGTLDQYGDFALYLPVVSDNANCIEWLILGSGDVTSQGLAGNVACVPGQPPVPQQGFLDGRMDSAEDGSYGLAVPPLFKSQTDKPPGETPIPQGWSLGPPANGSLLPTYGLWERVLPPLNGLIAYGGRFVYEQSGGTATDGCYFTKSQYLQVTTTLTGGGWFVDQSGDWGQDGIGFKSQFDSYYQDHYGPMGLTCQVTGPQTMYIDTRTGPMSYTTDQQMPARITPTELLTGVAPSAGQMVTECENYPSLKGKCK